MKWDPSKWEQDPNKWGQAGLIWNGNIDPRTLTNGSGGEGWTIDPRYQRRVQDYSSEGGGGSTFEFTDHYNKLFDNGNQVQIRDVKRLIDPNAAKWGGDEVGWLTHKDNYKSDDDWLDKNFFTLASLPLLGMTGLHMAGIDQAAGFQGLFGGADASAGMGASEAGTAAAAGAPGSSYAGAGMLAPGMENAALLDNFLINNGMSGLSGGVMTGLASGAPFAHLGGAGGALGGLLQGALKNPLQAVGLLQAARGLIGGDNGGASNGDAPGGPSGPFAPLPKGNRGAWSPNSFTQNQIQNFKYTGSR
jgi:hypothetical protein